MHMEWIDVDILLLPFMYVTNLSAFFHLYVLWMTLKILWWLFYVLVCEIKGFLRKNKVSKELKYNKSVELRDS